MGNKQLLSSLIVLGSLITGCDFAIQDSNEYIDTDLSAYYEKYGTTVSEDVRNCMRTFTISYVDSIEGGGNTATGETNIDRLHRTVYILKAGILKVEKTEQDMDITATHEYIHVMLFCMDAHDVNNQHKDPNFWTCTDSVENIAANMYGSTAHNDYYDTKCDKKHQPKWYNPRNF